MTPTQHAQFDLRSEMSVQQVALAFVVLSGQTTFLETCTSSIAFLKRSSTLFRLESFAEDSTSQLAGVCSDEILTSAPDQGACLRCLKSASLSAPRYRPASFLSEQYFCSPVLLQTRLSVHVPETPMTDV